MRFRFQTEQRLPYPLEMVFAFFADPANLPRLMPDWQHARIDESFLVAPAAPSSGLPIHQLHQRITAGSGTRITLSFRPVPLSPIRITWDALIEDFRWFQGFCDVQLRGPFRYWRHCHTVEPHRNGTLLHDEVEYELSLGPLNSIADNLIVQRQLAAMFKHRQRRTLELLAVESSLYPQQIGGI